MIKKLLQAAEQIEKAETVLKHLTSDFSPGPKITMTLILPNVPSERLRQLLEGNTHLLQVSLANTVNASNLVVFLTLVDQKNELH